MIRTVLQTLTVSLLAVGFLAAGGRLAPSDLAVDPELPHPEEVRLMEELSAWTGDDPTVAVGTPLPGADDLASSVQQYAESFALFRTIVGSYGRSATLATLPFGAQIERVAERYRVDPLLIAAVVSAESSFDPAAVSPVGARGLMQLMPETARYLAGSDEVGAEHDPMRNLELGALYLKRLMRTYGDDIPLVLAAYNSGPGNVRKFGGIPPFTETENYVERVLERYIDLQNAAVAAETFRLAEAGDAIAGSL